MKYLCPNCHEVLQITQEDLGHEGRCASCSGSLSIPENRFSPGIVIGDFLIQRLIGRGGMGDVFLAHQLTLDRTVALKVLVSDPQEAAEEVAVFLKGARACARLSHPNIVQVYSVGQEEDLLYLAMEYVEGSSLGQVLRTRGKLPLIQLADIATQVSEALDAVWKAHELVHCDIKPDNILLTFDGVAKLADFGLAQVYPKEGNDTNSFFGSPYYVAPEVVLGHRLDNRCDMYSLAATLFHLMTGHPPYEGDTAVDVAAKHVTEPPPKASDAAPDIPPGVDDVFRRALAKRPEDRYGNCGQLALALSGAVGLTRPMDVGEGGEAPPKALWRCEDCGALNHNWSAQCFRCGASGYELCPVCTVQLRVGTPRCPNCGADTMASKYALFREEMSILNRLEEAIEGSDYDAALVQSKKLSEYDGRPTPPDFQKRCAELMSNLRENLEELLRTARNDHDLGRMTQILSWLESFFGDERYTRLREELQTATTAIKNQILRARVAMKSHCFAHALATLTEEGPWKGGEIGSEREALIEECQVLLKQREAAMLKVRRCMEQEAHDRAIEESRVLADFRLPRRLIYRRLAREDLDFNARLTDLTDRLSKGVVARFRRLAVRDRWRAALALWDAVEEHDHLVRRGCREGMSVFLSGLVARRCNRAREFETKGSFREAAKAWRSVLRIPSPFLPIEAEQTARAFSFRRLKYLRNRRQRTLSRLSRVSAMLWLYPIWIIAQVIVGYDEAVRGPLLLTLLPIVVPLSLQFVLFGSVLRRLRQPDILVNDELIPRLQPSAFALGFWMLLAASPLTYIIYDVSLRIAGQTSGSASPISVTLALVGTGAMWGIMDLSRIGSCRTLPSALGLTLGWIVAAGVILGGHRLGISRHVMLPLACMAHGVAFLGIQWVHFHLHQRRLAVEEETAAATSTEITTIH